MSHDAAIEGRPGPWPGVIIFERIGEGGIADVFRASLHGREVALKVLRESDREGLRTRFLREGRLLQRLDHPGLVRCHEILDDEYTPAIALELLRGEGLEARIARRPLTGDEGSLLASSVLRTLAYLHENGVVHRDIKSANIFMAEDRRVILLDLGLAQDAADPTVTTLGEVVGTHAYMAPEQIAGAETDHRADLYGLGVTLYEALSGQRPFEARGLAAYLAAHRAGAAVPLLERTPDVPVRLATLIERLMARDAASRPSSASVALALLTGASGARRTLERPALVGRDGALGALHAILDVGGSLRVYAEFGGGVGAVARKALDMARAEGIEFGALRCRPRAGVEDMRRALARELGAAMGTVGSDDEALRRGLARMAAEGRYLLVVEDVDVAPPGVATWVRGLCGLPGLALLVTATTSEPDGAWPGRDLSLRALTLSETRALLCSMLAAPSPPAALDGALHRASGGLAALAVAIVREQVRLGAIWCEGTGEDGAPRWGWDPAARIEPGDDARRAVGRALSVLPPRTRELTEALAVAGAPLPMHVLLGAIEADASGIDLGPAVLAGLVRIVVESAEEWVSLRRGVLEPIIVGTLSDARVTQLHLRLASAAAGRPVGAWERGFVTLHAALGTDDPARTADLVTHGEWLADNLRPAEALQAFDVALRLHSDGVASLARVALDRADALCAMGRLPEARAALDAGSVLANEAGTRMLESGASLRHAELQLALGAGLGVEHATTVIFRAEEGDVRAAVAAAEVRARMGDLRAAAALADRYVQDGAAGAAPRVTVTARLLRASIALDLGDLRRATELFHAVANAPDGQRLPYPTCEALAGLSETHRRSGRLAAALESAAAAESLAHANALPWRFALAQIRRAEALVACGNVAVAADALRAHGGCGERSAPWFVRKAWLRAVSALREAEGDAPGALSAHLRAAEGGAQAHDLPFEALHAGLAAVYTGNPDGVAEAVERLQAIGSSRGLALLLLAGGRVGRAPELLEDAEQAARAAGEPLLLVRVLHAAGRDDQRLEAHDLVQAAAQGLTGGFRASFAARADVRWALEASER